MNVYKRALLYVIRKKGKSLMLFLLLLLITVSVMVGVSIRDGTAKAAENLRTTIGASFTMSGNINNLDFRDNEAGYTAEKIPISLNTVEQMITVEGIKTYNAEQHTSVTAEGIYYLSGMSSGSLSANTETAYQADFMNGILELAEGRHITEDDRDAALISYKLASENNLQVGSELILESASDDSREQTKVLIVGLYSSDGKMEYDNDTIFTTHDVYWKLSGQKPFGYSGNIFFYVTDPKELNHIVEQVQQIESIQWEDYFIRINESEYKAVAYQIQTMERLTEILITVIAGVGFIVVALVLAMRIKNRIHEAGIFLSVGESAPQIMLQLICEILMIAVLVFLVSPMSGQFIVGQVEAALKNMGTVIAMPISLKTTALQFLLETLIIVFAVVMAALPVARMKPKDILSKMS
nr:FtsX-like permease family protein [uncultured Acetatifactor sp.]